MILSIILGTPWQRKYKAVPDWETNSIKIRQEDGYIRQPFISPKAQTDFTTQTKEVLHKGKEVVSQSSIKQPPTKLTTSLSHSTLNFTKSKLVWRPKQQPTSPQRTHTPQTSIFWQVPSTQRYVPKKLLKAQHGQRQIWIPKNNFSKQHIICSQQRNNHSSKSYPQYSHNESLKNGYPRSSLQSQKYKRPSPHWSGEGNLLTTQQ